MVFPNWFFYAFGKKNIFLFKALTCIIVCRKGEAMSYLEKFGLSTLDYKKASDISEYFWLYSQIDNIADRRVDKEQKKKRILSITFEFLSGMFDLEYTSKLSFNNESQDGLYIEGITNLSYDEAFYKLYSHAFYKYIEKMHTLKGNEVDDDAFYIAKLAYLNSDQEILAKLINNTYIELLDKYAPLSINHKWEEITQEEIKKLEELNKDRINKIKERVFDCSIFDTLTFSGIKKLYTCFSKDIFETLNKKEKVYICNLLYNYFFFEKVDMSERYGTVINESSSSKDCLALIAESVQIPGKTLAIIKRNKDRVGDILSGIPTIYSNETRKENLFVLDDLMKKYNIKKK